MKAGAQLYTVHDCTKTLDGFAETLKKVADIGYTSVQVSGTCKFEPEWLAEQLKKNGLTCDLTHTAFEDVVADPDKVVADHKAFGCTNIGIGGWEKFYKVGVSTVPQFVEQAAPALKKIRESGCKFYYHNHAHEFKVENGKHIFEELAKAFPAELLSFTLDVYWAAEGGHDPVELIEKYPGRYECVHFKDMKTDADGKHIFAPVGEGVLDFDAIIAACEKAGTKYAFVEQDNCYGEDPFDCLKRSYDFLISKGLER